MSINQLEADVLTKQKRIAEITRNHKGESLKSLAHNIDLEWLYVAFSRVRKDSAPGIDGVIADHYVKNLRSNLERLLNEFKSGSYKAPAVKRVFIPKGNSNEKRALGVPTFEDKILQRAVHMVLEPVFEEYFYSFSHGFRAEHSAHLALDEFWLRCHQMNGGWLIDLDIRKYFDTIDHKLLRKMVLGRVCDGVITRILGKWLKAGVYENGNVKRSKMGTPQGGVISPLLSNLFLHVVLDEWFVEVVKPRMSEDSFMVRYADDALLLFKNREDALKVFDVIHKRFLKYGLELHPEKTKMMDFRNPSEGNKTRGTFNFLGFTHFWRKSFKTHRYYVGKRTAKDRFSRSLQAVNLWCNKHRHWKILEQWKHLSKVLVGHYGYYGIIGNSERISSFRYFVIRIWFKWLKRRSRLRDLNWERFDKLLCRFQLPLPRIVHTSNIARL